MRTVVVGCLPFEASIFSTRQENRDGGQQEETRRGRSRADRVGRALRGRLLVEEIQNHAGQAESRRQESGPLRPKKVEAYIKLQKHKAADRARIALSQPYE